MARRDLHECWQRQVDEMDAMEALHAEWFECDDEVTAAKIRSTLETTIVEDIPEAQENGLNLRYTIWLESCESTRTVGCRCVQVFIVLNSHVFCKTPRSS
eukprot:m.372928 g.372928  ORF g.372928 m.372928 type:complete len:100 (-) comp20881_c0_seq1:215-514(-)